MSGKDVSVACRNSRDESAHVTSRRTLAPGHAVWSAGCERFWSRDTLTDLNITANTTELLNKDYVYRCLLEIKAGGRTYFYDFVLK